MKSLKHEDNEYMPTNWEASKDKGYIKDARYFKLMVAAKEAMKSTEKMLKIAKATYKEATGKDYDEDAEREIEKKKVTHEADIEWERNFTCPHCQRLCVKDEDGWWYCLYGCKCGDKLTKWHPGSGNITGVVLMRKP